MTKKNQQITRDTALKMVSANLRRSKVRRQRRRQGARSVGGSAPEISVKAGEHSEQSGQESREDKTKHPWSESPWDQLQHWMQGVGQSQKRHKNNRPVTYRPGAILDGRVKIRYFGILRVFRTTPACRTVSVLFEG
jgi:hypothetical protein